MALPAEPVRALPFSGGPVAVAITFEGAYGFVAEGDSARVQMFDPAAREVIATLNVGGAPRAIDRRTHDAFGGSRKTPRDGRARWTDATRTLPSSRAPCRGAGCHANVDGGLGSVTFLTLPGVTRI